MKKYSRSNQLAIWIFDAGVIDSQKFYNSLGKVPLYLVRRTYLLNHALLQRLLCHTCDDLSFGWHLEEIHVTWAHLEKKRTRLQLYTIYIEELCSQSMKTASRFLRDDVRILKVTGSVHNFVGVMELETDIENMMLEEYSKYESKKENTDPRSKVSQPICHPMRSGLESVNPSRASHEKKDERVEIARCGDTTELLKQRCRRGERIRGVTSFPILTLWREAVKGKAMGSARRKNKEKQDKYSPYKDPNMGMLQSLTKSPREIFAYKKVVKTFTKPPK
nr:hypothetical protein [Tanacetum cinerariifolium]